MQSIVKNIRLVFLFAVGLLVLIAPVAANVTSATPVPMLSLPIPMSMQQLFYANDSVSKRGAVQQTAGQFVMSGASNTIKYNSIQFLRLSFYSGAYTSAGCGGSLLGVLSVVDNTYGKPFSNGQLISLNSYSIYSLVYNSSLNTSISQIQCVQVYMDGSNNYANGINVTTFQQSCAGGVCTTTTPAQLATWQYNPIRGYVRNLYLASLNASANSYIVSCLMSPADGSLSSCSNGFEIPALAAVTTFNNGYAYVASTGEIYVNYCAITLSGSFPVCVVTGPNNDARLYGLATSAGYIYIAYINITPSGFGVAACHLIYSSNAATNGSIDVTSCQNIGTTSGVTTPYGLSVYNGNLYIATTASPGVLSCPILNNGGLGACTSAIGAAAGGPYTNVYGVSFYNGYMYFASSTLDGVNGAVYACTIDGTGKASSCISTTIANAQTVAFNSGTNNNFAYVTATNFPVTICTVSPTNGALGSCTTSAVGTSTYGSVVY